MLIVDDRLRLQWSIIVHAISHENRLDSSFINVHQYLFYYNNWTAKESRWLNMNIFVTLSGVVYRVWFHQHGGLQSQLLLLLDVVANVAQLLFHHAHRLKVCRVVEGVTSQQQQLHPDTHIKRMESRWGKALPNHPFKAAKLIKCFMAFMRRDTLMR